MQNLASTAEYLQDEVEKMGDGMFEVLSEGRNGVPLVAFRIVKDKPYDGELSRLGHAQAPLADSVFPSPYAEFAIAAHMRQRGWILPAYTLFPKASASPARSRRPFPAMADSRVPSLEQEVKVLRVVVREDLSRSRCETLVRDLREAIDALDHAPVEMQRHLSKSQAAGDTRSKHHPTRHSANRSVHMHEKHSLAGKHGKTHAVC